MKILAVNSGSSSLKFQVYEMPSENVIMKGIFERIGLENSEYTIKVDGKKIKKETTLNNHEDAVSKLVEELLSNQVIEQLEDIDAVGHRIVHGGNQYSTSVVVDDKVIKDLESLQDLAPLHNPAGILGIKAFRSFIPNAVQVACFDTAFHQTMEKENYLYSVPYEWFSKYDVRKYGFHGLSHKYITSKMEEVLGKEDVNLIICHIGNGGSLSAIKSSKCIDTSMGLTPNAGIMMGTRSGDIDYTMIGYLMNKTEMTYQEIDSQLNKKSGLLGICGHSDLRDVDDKFLAQDEQTVLAVNMYTRRIADYIAKYYLQLNGQVDAICFTAGGGENDPIIRKEVLTKISPLGINIDEEKNNETVTRKGNEGLISDNSSKIPVYVYATDEELVIARDSYFLTK